MVAKPRSVDGGISASHRTEHPRSCCKKADEEENPKCYLDCSVAIPPEFFIAYGLRKNAFDFRVAHLFHLVDLRRVIDRAPGPIGHRFQGARRVATPLLLNRTCVRDSEAMLCPRQNDHRPFFIV